LSRIINLKAVIDLCGCEYERLVIVVEVFATRIRLRL
jgi:hypothetical protein